MLDKKITSFECVFMVNKINKSNENLLKLAEKLSSKDAVIKTSVDWKIVSWSLGAEKMYGYSEGEVKGHNLIDLLQPQELDVSQELRINRQNKDVNSYESVHITKDGKLINVRQNVALIKDLSGNVIENSIIIRNTTERRRGAPMPANEVERLDALYQYKILDTQSEDNFDDLTKLASYICQTPIALISLVDAERQWFKSKIGLDISQTPRELAFCGYTILQNEVLHVEDTIADERFFDNPLVTTDPHIRFYAGAPLITTSGSAIGSICVLDSAPKKLNDEQLEMLKILSRMVMRELDKRKQISELKNQDLRLKK
ncbi:MAG TPA: GAF domain-containing protein [Oculatellaceae cyanobacterium]|jgi:PAS domain S-box-containing protein